MGFKDEYERKRYLRDSVEKYGEYRANFDHSEPVDAAKDGNALFFCANDKKLYLDFECTKLAPKLDGKRVLLRGHVGITTEMYKAVGKWGGKTVSSIEEEKKVMNWTDFRQPTHRHIKKGELKDLMKELDGMLSKNKKIFLKTVEKNFNGIVKSFSEFGLNIGKSKLYMLKTEGDYVQENPPVRMHMRGGGRPDAMLFEDTQVMATEFVDFEKIRIGLRSFKREYRTYVIDGEICAMDFYFSDEGIKHSAPPEVIQHAKALVEEMKTLGFPDTYVVDLGVVKTKKGSVVDIVEFGPITASYKDAHPHMYNMYKQFKKSKQMVLGA